MKRIMCFVLLACSIAAHAGTEKNDSLKRSRDMLELTKQLEIFSSAYFNLDTYYVDTLNPKQVIEAGIKGMLRSLDPYTEFYPATDAKELKSMITGKYGGIGSVVSYNLKDSVTVINEPYYGMPAQEAGLRKGDHILAIDGKNMRGKATSYVSDHLRGDAGTTFMLTIKRPGEKKERDVKITRRAIQLPSIPYYGMLNDTIGYIVLNQFTDDCSAAFRNSLLELKGKGMKRLVFDLRGNTGGALIEAVRILNMFLPKGISLVKTKGKIAKTNTEYRTTEQPIDTIMPIVCLVNGASASASEIVSGVLQDLDRGVVLGEKTFGKGLVQVPISMPYNTALKVTTSHYYIPSGRCIQAITYKRDGKEEVADTLKKTFKTKNGRAVKGGGGIMPDITHRPDSLPNIVYYLQTSGIDSTNVMMEYIIDYLNEHKEIATPKEFKITDEEYDGFCQRVINSGFKYDRASSMYMAELIKVAKFEGYYNQAKKEFDALEKKLEHDLAIELKHHEKEIRTALENDIVTCYHYQSGAIEYMLQKDKTVAMAIGLLEDNAKYSGVLSGNKK